jgi:hypothetical protein
MTKRRSVYRRHSSSPMNGHHSERPPRRDAIYLIGAADWFCGGAVVVSGSAA